MSQSIRKLSQSALIDARLEIQNVAVIPTCVIGDFDIFYVPPQLPKRAWTLKSIAHKGKGEKGKNSSDYLEAPTKVCGTVDVESKVKYV